jgi:excisionase family DNA binding protein
MGEPEKQIVQLKPGVIPSDKLLVTMSAGELRALVEEVVEEKLRCIVPRGNGLLTVEEAAKFLGYSKDWLFKNWRKVGGKKIGGRGVRFDAADLESWIKSRG